MILELGQKEVKRMKIMEELKFGLTTIKIAAKRLKKSVRQVRRIFKSYKQKGMKGLIHGNKGRPSNRKLDPAKTKLALDIMRRVLVGFGPTLAAEKLAEIYDIIIHPQTLRRYMIKDKLWIVGTRRRKQHKRWREPKKHFGELAQLDGSKHKWVKSSDKYWTLIQFVDDATKTILYSKFYDCESTINIMDATKEYFKRYGKPVAIYVDKGSVYKINLKNCDFDRTTQYERFLKEVDVELKHAHSPQAKGRIERSFKTAQDRLPKEFLLGNITTIEAANKFLEEYYVPQMNAKFARPPQEKKDLHTPVLKHEFEKYLCLKFERRVHNDWTVLYKNRYFQLDSNRPAIVKPKDTVTICEYLDGKIKIEIRDNNIEFRELKKRRKIEKRKIAKTSGNQHKPGADHPWKLYSICIQPKRDIFNVIKRGTFLL